MGMNLSIRSLAAWIACFAILFAALAPTISHALAASRGTSDLAEVCSVGGAKLVSVSDGQADGSAPVPAKSFKFEHCAFCTTHGGSFALLPQMDSHIAAPAMPDSHPKLFYLSPRPLPIWSAAQSRAPPALA